MHRANVVCMCARWVTPCCSSLRPRFEPCQQEHTTTFGNGGTLNTVQCAHAVPGWCFLSPHDHGPRAIRAFFGENLKCYSGLPAFLVPIAGFFAVLPPRPGSHLRVRPNPNSRLPRTPRRGADCGPHGRQSGVLMCSLRTGCPRTATTDLCHDPLPVGECGGALRGSPRQLRHHLRDSNPANQNRRTRCTSARTAPVKILKCHLGCPRG